ncbi:MAG: hypothetical protein HYZ37_15805 [Candidatus Solibacter usitatus]|nr:hypothetical protein [Candidatus Solibacter usitatus]
MRCFVGLLAASFCFAGPVEFGQEELRKACEARNFPPNRIRVAAELLRTLKPESYEIMPWRVSGGDLRGLMYGLLDAADQIRATGKLTQTKAEPFVSVRGVRLVLKGADWQRIDFRAYFQTLARRRFNRVHVDLEPIDLEALKSLSREASDHAIDVTLGGNFNGVSIEALTKLLTEARWIRGLAVHDATAEMLRRVVIPALSDVGRLVTLELSDGPALTVARESGVATRILTTMDNGVAYPDLETVTPSDLPVIRVVAQSKYTDPQFVASVAYGSAIGEALGYEVFAPLALDDAIYAAWGLLGYTPSRRVDVDPAIACAARLQRPSVHPDQLQRCGVVLERSAGFEKMGQAATVRFRLLWAKQMEAYYEKTKHDSALRAAYYSYRAAARTEPAAQAEVARVGKLVDQLDPDAPVTAMPWSVPAPRPSIVHKTPAALHSGSPLALSLAVSPNNGITSIRLRYRYVGGADGFRTLTGAARQASFTIPAEHLPIPGQLLYYFELEFEGGVWRAPEDDAPLPVFVGIVKQPPPPTDEEEKPLR